VNNAYSNVPSYSGNAIEEVLASSTVRFHAFSDWLNRHVILASLIVLLCSLSPRLFLTLQADPQDLTTPDSPAYLSPAKSLLESGSFYKGDKPEIARTPAYPAFLAALMYVVGEDLRNLLVAQTIVLSSSVVILYLLARRILPPVMAFTGALLAAFSPWGAARAGLLMSEGLYLLVLALLFYLMSLVGERTAKLSSVFLGGCCIGLMTSIAVLVRPVWPLVPLVGLVLFFLYGDKRQRSWILIVAMVISAITPLSLWKTRNLHEAQFDGLSITGGKTAYRYFASSVKAQIKGAEGDKFKLMLLAREEESHWQLSNQETEDERWRRVRDVVREHPILSIYTFALNAGGSIVHPDPYVLIPARLNFPGDVWVLGGMWAALVGLAWLGLRYAPDKERDHGWIKQKWLWSLLGICLLLTLPSGLSFGAGSRFRAPLELIVPLLAGVGLVRAIRLADVYLLARRQERFTNNPDLPPISQTPP
jgi:hypothetical protein